MFADIDLLVASALIGVTFLLVFSKPRLVRSEHWTLFRSLLPSWRFFEAIAPAPMLHARAVEAGTHFGPWTPVLGHPRRRWYGAVSNAEGNLRLAYGSVIERLVQELDGRTTDHAAHLVSYQLVQRIVESSPALSFAEGPAYQFMLEDTDTGEVLFVSPVHERSDTNAARAR